MNIETLVYLGDNKELNLLGADGVPRQLTYALTLGEQNPCLWPTWSNDGAWLAYFQAPGDRTPARLCITQTQGLEMKVLAEMHDRMPIYLFWGPKDDRLAVVEQTPDGVELLVYFMDGRPPVTLDDGAPIFFDWVGDGEALIAHVVSPVRKRSRLQQYFLDEPKDDVLLSEDTGGFAVPIVMNDRVLFAERKDGMTHLQAMNLQTKDRTQLGAFDGMLGMQLHPSREILALSVSNPEDGAYTVQMLNLKTGDLTLLANDPDPNVSVQAMFWSHDGQYLLMSVVNAAQRWLEWQYWDGQDHQVINQFLPAREQLFYLHFFEQFSKSHRIFCQDGSAFYFAAYEPPNRRTTFPPKPWIYKGTLAPKSEFEQVQLGLFPVLGPSPHGAV